MNLIQQMIENAVSGLEEKKGEDIKVIDISEISPISDYFVLASGSNRNQVQAMADSVKKKTKKKKKPLRKIFLTS